MDLDYIMTTTLFNSSEVIVGTTNFDGTGSATNLTIDNATDYGFLMGTGSVDDLIADLSVSGGVSSMTSVLLDTWNQTGFKEVSIDNNSSLVHVKNFVDVDIDNDNSVSSDIFVENAKRGHIDTGSGSDSIYVSVTSNSSLWDNTFHIDSGAGNDVIILTNASNSQYTSFDINADSGNDTVNVSGLYYSETEDVTRHVDGGSGLDVLMLSGQDTVDFENFEVIKGVDQGTDTAAITVDQSLLSDNDSSAFDLVFSNVDIAIDDSLDTSSADLTQTQSDYLTSQNLDASDFIAVTVTADDGSSYGLLTNDTDYSHFDLA